MGIKIERLEVKCDVYDLTVEDNHNFFANDILVHNCTESYSNVSPDEYAHTCNLASIVAGRIKDKEHLIRIARLATRVLDNGITLTNPPTEISAAHNNRYRTIGVGIQGMHDWLALNGKSYRDIKDIQGFAETIQYGCVLESIELAKERGAYPAFEGSTWSTGEQFEHYRKHSVAGLDWTALEEKCKKVGIRNSQLTSPAPNTSTSIFMDAAAGFMPVYAAFFFEDNKNGKMPVVAMHMKENPLCYEQTFPRYDQMVLARAVGAAQKFIDTGISAEYVLDHNRPDFSAKYLYDLIMTAWSSGTKAIYYIRHVKKGQTVDDLLGIETACVGCAG